MTPGVLRPASCQVYGLLVDGLVGMSWTPVFAFGPPYFFDVSLGRGFRTPLTNRGGTGEGFLN